MHFEKILRTPFLQNSSGQLLLYQTNRQHRKSTVLKYFNKKTLFGTMTIKQLKHLTLFFFLKENRRKFFSDLDALADYLNKPVATALTREVNQVMINSQFLTL